MVIYRTNNANQFWFCPNTIVVYPYVRKFSIKPSFLAGHSILLLRKELLVEEKHREKNEERTKEGKKSNLPVADSS